MVLQWFERNQSAVAEALRRGERPEMATTMDSGPLDDLVALHDELGVFEALDQVPIKRRRRSINDQLLLRTASVLPFLESPSLSGAAGLLFRNPAILLHLGWSVVQIQMGDNERHGNPDGRRPTSLPCHPETLRNELARIERDAWLNVQRSGDLPGVQHRTGLVGPQGNEVGRSRHSPTAPTAPTVRPATWRTADNPLLALLFCYLPARRTTTNPRRSNPKIPAPKPQSRPPSMTACVMMKCLIATWIP